ncbi:Hypothetical protein GSB_151922 [Giardia duodenalis]|uniref:Uncharacterized protein n=2 Tax=Giardia intestinalis TaxID=5741 RepID=C6M0D1_GIAIB|nr:Hypothetical protein GL50581_4519 [Giardia intestinalis ATCC 50581]ESU43505.1 Hypothetical protein GSB_151922 [Giardia intestinalis]
MRIVLLLIRRVGPSTEALSADLSSPVFKDLVYLDFTADCAARQKTLLSSLQRVVSTERTATLSLGIEHTTFVLLDGIEREDLHSLGLCAAGQVSLVSGSNASDTLDNCTFPELSINLRHFYCPIQEVVTKPVEKGKGKPDSKNEAQKLENKESRDYIIDDAVVDFPLLLSVAQELLREWMHRRLYMAHLRASRIHNISGHSIWLDVMPPAVVTPGCPSLNCLYDTALLGPRMLRLYKTRMSYISPADQNHLSVLLGAMVDAVVLCSPDPKKADAQPLHLANMVDNIVLSEENLSLDVLQTHETSIADSQKSSNERSDRQSSPAEISWHGVTGESSTLTDESIVLLDRAARGVLLFPLRSALHSESTCFTPFEGNNLFTRRFEGIPSSFVGMSRFHSTYEGDKKIQCSDGDEHALCTHESVHHIDEAWNSVPMNTTTAYAPLYDIYTITLNHCVSEEAKIYKKRALDAQIEALDIQKLIEEYFPERNYAILENFRSLSPRTVMLRRSDFQELIRLFLKESPQPLSIQEAETLVRKTLVLHLNELLMADGPSSPLPANNILDITAALPETVVHKNLQYSTVIKLGTKTSEAQNRLAYYTALVPKPIVPVINYAYFEPLTNSLCLSQKLIKPNEDGIILKTLDNTNELILKYSLLCDVQRYLLRTLQELCGLLNIPYDSIAILATTVPCYLDWLNALEQFTPVSAPAESADSTSVPSICYCYAEDPGSFNSFLYREAEPEKQSTTQLSYQISPHRARKQNTVSQFIDFIIEGITEKCIATYRQLVEPTAPTVNCQLTSSCSDNNLTGTGPYLDNGGQYMPVSQKNISDSLSDTRPQGSRTKQRDTNNSRLSQSDSPYLGAQCSGLDADAHSIALEGFEPIVEEAVEINASVSSRTNDRSLTSLFITDPQWIYFYSDNIPCLMAQLGPIAPLKPESHKDFFIRHYYDAMNNSQKDVPQKGKQASSAAKDKGLAVQPTLSITSEDVAEISLELALSLILFELYGDEPSAFILNSLLGLLNPDYDDLMDEESYSKQKHSMHHLRLSGLKKHVRNNVSVVYYAQTAGKGSHCMYLNHKTQNKNVALIAQLREAISAESVEISRKDSVGGAGKSKDSKQKEQASSNVIIEASPFSKSQYGHVHSTPHRISRTLFADFVKIKAQSSFSIYPNYRLRDYSTFYLTPNDKSSIASSPLQRRIDFYRMWASLFVQPDSDLGTEDYADHFVMLPEAGESMRRVGVISQKDVSDEFGPLTTSLPMVSKLNILFGDKSMAIIRQYTLTYILSDSSVFVDISHLQETISSMASAPEETGKSITGSSKNPSRTQSRSGTRGSVKPIDSEPVAPSSVEEEHLKEQAPREHTRTLVFKVAIDEDLLYTKRPEFARFALIAELCGALIPSRSNSCCSIDHIEFAMYSDASCTVQCNGIILFNLTLAEGTHLEVQVTAHEKLSSPSDSIDTLPNFISNMVYEMLGFLTEYGASKIQSNIDMVPGKSFAKQNSSAKSSSTPFLFGDEVEKSEISMEYAKLVPDIASVALARIPEELLSDGVYSNETHALLIDLPIFNTLIVRFLMSKSTLFLLSNGDTILIEGSYMYLFRADTAFLSILQVKSAPSTCLIPTQEGPSAIPVYSSPLVLYASQGFPFWNVFFEQRKKWLVTRKIPERINFNPKSRPHLGQHNIERESIALKDTLTLARQICDVAQREYSEFPAVYPRYLDLFDTQSVWRMHHEAFVAGTDSVVVPLRGVTRFLLGSPELHGPDNLGHSMSPYPPSLSLLDWTGNTIFCRLGCTFEPKVTKFIAPVEPVQQPERPLSKEKGAAKKEPASPGPQSSKKVVKESSRMTTDVNASTDQQSQNGVLDASPELACTFTEEKLNCFNSTRPFLPPVIPPKVQADVVVELERVLQEREEKVLQRILKKEQLLNQTSSEPSTEPSTKKDTKEKAPKKPNKDVSKPENISQDELSDLDVPLELHRELTDILSEVNPIKTYSALQLFFKHFSEIAQQKLEYEIATTAAQASVKTKDPKAQATPVPVNTSKVTSMYLSRKKYPQTAEELLDDCLQDSNGIPLPCCPIINPRFFVYPISPDLQNALNYSIEDECMGYLRNCEPWVCIHNADISYLRYIGMLHQLVGSSHYTAISPRSSQAYLKIATTGRLSCLPRYLSSIPLSSVVCQILNTVRSALAFTDLPVVLTSSDSAYDTSALSTTSKGRMGAKGVITGGGTHTTIAQGIALPPKLQGKATWEADTPDPVSLHIPFGEQFLSLFDPNSPYLLHPSDRYAANVIEFLELHSFLTKGDLLCYQHLEQTKLNWKISAAQRDIVIQSYQKMETTGIELGKALTSVIAILKKEKKQREREAMRELEQQEELARQMALFAEQHAHSNEEDKNEVSYDYSVDKPTKSAKPRKHMSAKKPVDMALPKIANLSPPPPDWKRQFSEEDLDVEYAALSVDELHRTSYVEKYPLLKHVPLETDLQESGMSSKTLAHQAIIQTTTGNNMLRSSKNSHTILRAIPNKINIRQRTFNILVKSLSEEVLSVSLVYDHNILTLSGPLGPITLLPHISIDLHFEVKLHRPTEIVIKGETLTGNSGAVVVPCVGKLTFSASA